MMDLKDKHRISAKLTTLAEWLAEERDILDRPNVVFNPSTQGWTRLALELDAISLFIRSRFDASYPTDEFISDGQQRTLAALLKAHEMTSKSVYQKSASMSVGVDIAASCLAGFGILPKELLDEYVRVTMS